MHAIGMYNNHKSLDEIVEECDQVWRIVLAHSNKCPRTQVNLVENISQEEEEQAGQAAINFVDDDAARLQRHKHPCRTCAATTSILVQMTGPVRAMDALSSTSEVSCQSKDRETAEDEDSTRPSILLRTTKTK